MEITSARGEQLRGWYIPLAGEGKRIAFLIHGYRSARAETPGLYRGPKDCLFVDGARHVECMYVDPAGYAEKLDGMIAAYF